MTVHRPKPRKLPPADTTRQAGLGTLNYDELPGLEGVYLEDSYVRDIAESPLLLGFTLLVALGPDHPQYVRPRPGERHCYLAATLTFPDVRKITWHARHDREFFDADRARDLGNIDRFTAEPQGYYHLEGEWGSVDIASGAPQLDVLAPEPHARAHVREEYAAWIAGTPLKKHAHHH